MRTMLNYQETILEDPSFSELTLKYEQTLIRISTSGVVVRISPTLVAKFKKFPTPSDLRGGRCTSLEDECAIADELYKNGVLVPKPIGVSNIRCMIEEWTRYKLVTPAFVMQHLCGILLKDLEHNEKFKEIDRLRYKEIRKAGELGFAVEDANLSNCIWVPDNGVYLIDFSYWYKKAS